MHINYKYILYKANQLSQGNAAILDFGCGNGEVVQHGRHQGLNMYGVDSFMRKGAKRILYEKNLLGDIVREIKDKKIPFEDGFFDLIVSNQVLEHVDDLPGVLDEIHRVLKPNGKFLALFPSKDVIREGHYGIPMSHWFPKKSRARFYYSYGLRKLGFGYMKKNKPARIWTTHAMNYLDKKTFYRPRKEIYKNFKSRFKISMIEDDYCAFRLRAAGKNAPANLLKLPIIKSTGKEMFRRLSCLVILASKQTFEKV